MTHSDVMRCALVYNILAFFFVFFAGILVVFFCVTKKEQVIDEVIGDSGGTLIKSNYEAPGEEVVMAILKALPGQLSQFVLYM